MPQLLMIAAIGAGAYLGIKWLRSRANDFQKELKRAMHEAEQRSEKQPKRDDDIPTLTQDPETGVYRLERD